MNREMLRRSLEANRDFYERVFGSERQRFEQIVSEKKQAITDFHRKMAEMELQLRTIEAGFGCFRKYSPDQPRDDHGRWTSGGGTQTADAGNIATDAQVDGSDNKFDTQGAIAKLNQAADKLKSDQISQGINKFGDAACAHYVTQALNEGGGLDVQTPDDGGHAYAKDYGPSLEAAGFQQIVSATNTGNLKAAYPPIGYTPQPGDVVVIQGYDGDQIGHMAMYTGQNSNGTERWVSDFVQPRGFWPGSGYNTNQPSYAIYRYPNNQQ